MPDEFSLEELRAAVRSLRAMEPTSLTLPLRDDIFITYEGVVCCPGVCYMHPEAFRDLMGEEAYQEILRRPRKPSEYTGCDCPSCKRADGEENA